MEGIEGRYLPTFPRFGFTIPSPVVPWEPYSISLTLDDVPFEAFGAEISPYLAKKRLFVSACEVVNTSFVEAVNGNRECHSIIGPDEEISYDDAAVMWVSFYHLMLRDSNKMETQEIMKVLTKLKETFGVTFRYF